MVSLGKQVKKSMFLTEKQAEERLASGKNLANAEFLKSQSVSVTEKKLILPGKNRINLKIEERNEIAARARTGESASSIAREKGITVATVTNIANGKTKGVDEEKIEKIIGEARDRALDRLMASLGLITDDKLSGCSAKDLSVIASNMGRVVEKIRDKVEQPDNINFIIYAPELKQERAYDSVEV